MRETDPDRLLTKARQGDIEAFAALFEPLRARSFTIASRLVGPDDAPDVVMDAFLKAWKALPRFHGHSRLATWLYRIVWNCAADHRRSRLRRRETPLPEDEAGQTLDLPDTAAENPAEKSAQADRVDLLQAAMERLPDAMRVTLLLRFADALSYREIAAATGVRIGTVMSRLFHGRRQLKRLLEAFEQGEQP